MDEWWTAVLKNHGREDILPLPEVKRSLFRPGGEKGKSSSITNGRPSQSLRTFLSLLDERNELIPIRREVNPSVELAVIIQDIQMTVFRERLQAMFVGVRGSVLCKRPLSAALGTGGHRCNSPDKSAQGV